MTYAFPTRKQEEFPLPRLFLHLLTFLSFQVHCCWFVLLFCYVPKDPEELQWRRPGRLFLELFFLVVVCPVARTLGSFSRLCSATHIHNRFLHTPPGQEHILGHRYEFPSFCLSSQDFLNCYPINYLSATTRPPQVPVLSSRLFCLSPTKRVFMETRNNILGRNTSNGGVATNTWWCSAQRCPCPCDTVCKMVVPEDHTA